ncbi:hypothetical protein [Microbacterium gorillae]|uniref:hypothetical protein n=1 Tax=Microbacterium gorillae TaxID=1231063 RepID=UPI000590ECFD|nr:hypothetical protein [Microbacterium gorillae]
MNDESDRELRALRARAYGPAADIGADEAARSRLAELEQDRRPGADTSAAQRRAPRVGVADVPPAATSPVPPTVPDAEVTVPAPIATPASPWRVSGRVGLIWAGSVAAAIVVSGLVATALIPPVPLITGATHEASLPVDPGFAWEGWGSDRGFATFFGMRPMVFEVSGQQSCLFVAEDAKINRESSSFRGVNASACGTKAMPAVATLLIDENCPTALRDRFGDGTSLRFVLQDSAVDVSSAKD